MWCDFVIYQYTTIISCVFYHSLFVPIVTCYRTNKNFITVGARSIDFFIAKKALTSHLIKATKAKFILVLFITAIAPM